MARDMPPTLRQRRLGAELRKLRERAGLKSTAAAAQIGIQQARLSMMEAGRYAVGADRVRAIAHTYACDDAELVEALAGMTGGRERGWWDEYRELLSASLVECAELENDATSLRVAAVMNVPGLLQTAAHARVSFKQSVPSLRAHELEHRTSFRMKRQAALYGEPAMRYTAIVHEAVLRLGFAGPEVSREQLHHLIEMGEHDNVRVLVIPFGLSDFPAAGQPVTYATGSVPQLDTVVLDTDHGCDFLDGEAQLARYRTVLDRMESCSLPPGKSRDFIRRVAKSL
ncbi:helix-turn-helix domain-containing protein [Streptomyces sp. NPDC056987]|uniref:helix-turn-helix domain-containing protein n=1 Tax=Streptomyces sp. NPDC056987 TaxID=3345988 RepID=UPI003633E8CB